MDQGFPRGLLAQISAVVKCCQRLNAHRVATDLYAPRVSPVP